MSDLNSGVRAAIDSMDLDKARDLIRQALPTANADTFYLASLVTLDDEQKREFLQKALDLDPFHRDAYKALNAMNSTARPEAKPQQSTSNAWGISPAAPASSTPIPVPVLTQQPVIQQSHPEPTPQSDSRQAVAVAAPAAPVQITVTNPEAYLYRIPQKQRRDREAVASGTVLQVIGRDFDPKWINVGFKHQGATKIGWIQAGDVSKPKQSGGKEWDFAGLPVTYYQYNTGKELKQIEAKVRSVSSKSGIGLVIGAIVAAVVVLLVASSISQDYGVIFGSIIAAGLIIAALYLRASSIAPLIRQVHILQRLRKSAPANISPRYVPYTGWPHPLPQQIEQADREYEIDRLAARRKATRNAVIFAVIAGGWLGLLFLSRPTEAAIDTAVFCSSLLAVFMAGPVVSYLAVYATDEEKAMALVGVAAAVAVLAAGAATAKGGAIERRKEQEEAAARAREKAQRQQKERELQRKTEEEQKRKNDELRRQQQFAHQATQGSSYTHPQYEVSQSPQREEERWKDDYAAWSQERDWNAKHGYE